jgi:hypothetical protein
LKKVYLSLVVALLAAMPLCAEDDSNGLFLGAYGGYAFRYTYLDTVLEDRINGHRYDGYALNEYDDYGDGAFDYGVKIGWYFEDSDMRAYLSYERSTKAKDNDGYSDFSDRVSKISMGYDIAFIRINDFRFIAGGTLGYAHMRLKVKNNSGSHKASYDGIDIGGKVGAIYDIDQKNELEFGLKTNYSVYNEKTIGRRTINTREYDVNINPYQFKFGLYLGYNFKF